MGTDGEFDLVARAIRGVEWIAEAEIEARLGTEPLSVGHREVRFRADALYPVLLELGTVDDVFIVVGEKDGIGHTRAELARIAAAAACASPESSVRLLRELRPIPGSPAFDVSATFLGRRNYNRFEIEDAVGVAVARTTGWRYESRTETKPPHTDLTLRVHLDGERATFGLRVGASPTHRRPYRKVSRTASLRPPLARCLALLAGLSHGSRLLDPFCGAGTIPIEAVLAERQVVARGSDIDREVVDLARANVAAAGVECELAVADAGDLRMPGQAFDRLVTNPPWGAAVHTEGSRADVWREIARVLGDDARIVVLGPSELLDAVERAVGRPRVLRQPVRVLGMSVEIVLLGETSSFSDAGALYGAELDRALQRSGA